MELLNLGDLVKNAGAISWSEVDSREAALIERCAAGDDSACGELVAAHQRMVYNLALHLLGDRDEALDLSQEVFMLAPGLPALGKRCALPASYRI